LFHINPSSRSGKEGPFEAVVPSDMVLSQPYNQWRLVARISAGAAPENCIFFINWGMATDIKLKDIVQV
jgi:hypothetical protein